MFRFCPGQPGGVPGLFKFKIQVMDKRLMKIIAFLQRLQVEAIQGGIYSFHVGLLKHYKGLIVTCDYTLRDGGKMKGVTMTAYFFKDDCRALGDAIKDIRAFLKAKKTRRLKA